MGIPAKKLGMSNSKNAEFGMGWRRDRPDFRDYTTKTKVVADMLANKKINVTKKLSAKGVPCGSADLRPWCTPIENQEDLGSCTANAGVGLYEYMELAGNGNWVDASRLFLYKTTRDLMGLTGDTGAELRSTMGGMVLFGVPPESYWPYQPWLDIGGEPMFDTEPSAFCYSFAENYKAIYYYRLDYYGLAPADLLTTIKIFLCAYLPSMFGFTVYDSIWQANANGMIPYPSPGENIIGGHAIDAVGFDDGIQITNNISGDTTTGALLIRNSWGDQWGMNGYGWLPYDYVLNGLAVDWWTILSDSYVNTEQFGFP